MAMTSASRLDAVLADFDIAWRSGERPRAEGWIDRLDCARPAEAAELIYHEFCLAEADGLSPRPDDYLTRFPDRRESLSRLFELHTMTAGEGGDGSSPLPEVGDEIGPYRLCRLMGRGSFSGVYLAEQADLAGRYVVVKITSHPSPEPELLARISHPHIVGVLRQGETPDGTFQLTFMPFLGGATLLDVANETRRLGCRPRSGRDLLKRLDSVSAREYPAADLTRPAREILETLSYPKAVAYIFARLAEALDHAYRRGVAHGDVKPSNILFTADGSPMLLDFNLAIDFLRDATSLGGGTPAYMPPERLRAIDRPRPVGNDSSESLDLHRSDIYSLGLVLVETMTGIVPFVAQGRPSDIAAARDGGVTVFPRWEQLPIPAGLRPILAHCLAADPSERFVDGRSLAADLDRWRGDLPPLSAPDSGLMSRLTRWVSRRRVLVSAWALTMVAAIGAGTVISSKYQRTIRDRAEEQYGQFLDKNDLGLFGFRPFAAWANPSVDLAEVARKKLNAYGVIDDPRWRERDDVRTLSEPHRADLELLMLEQVYRLALTYSKRPDSRDDWRRAFEIVDRECRNVSTTPMERLRADLRSKLGLPELAAPTVAPPRPSWVEEYLLGVAAEPVNATAFKHYERAIEARPDLLWPRYRDAVSAFPIGQYTEASIHLRSASAMRPDNPALHMHLGTALLRLGRREEARDECDRAIAIDPDFASAYLNRSYVEHDLDRPDLSRKDTERFARIAQASMRDAETRMRFQALGYDRLMNKSGHADASRGEELIRRLRLSDPSDPELLVSEALEIGLRGQAAQGIATLDSVLTDHPEHLRARYARAFLLQAIGRDDAPREYAALIEDPRFEELYREQPDALTVYHHVSHHLLKQRRFSEAIKVAETGLTQALRIHVHVPDSHYAVARAIAAEAGADPLRLEIARGQLRKAVEGLDTLRNWYFRDPYFSEMRKADPSFLKERETPVR